MNLQLISSKMAAPEEKKSQLDFSLGVLVFSWVSNVLNMKEMIFMDVQSPETNAVHLLAGRDKTSQQKVNEVDESWKSVSSGVVKAQSRNTISQEEPRSTTKYTWEPVKT